MKKIVLIVICLVNFAFTNFAQNSAPVKEDIATVRAKNLEQIATACKSVGLDEKQTAKAKLIIENFYKKQDEINNDASLTPEAKNKSLKMQMQIKIGKFKT